MEVLKIKFITTVLCSPVWAVKSQTVLKSELEGVWRLTSSTAPGASIPFHLYFSTFEIDLIFQKKTEDFSPNISQLRTAKVEQRIPSHTSTHQINTPASLGHITWPKASLRHKTYINNKVMVFFKWCIRPSDAFGQVMVSAKWGLYSRVQII